MDVPIGVVVGEGGLPAPHGHLGVPGAGHGPLVDVGAADDDVGVVHDHHLAVDVDGEPQAAPELFGHGVRGGFKPVQMLPTALALA